MNINELIQYFTNYRDSLTEYLKACLDNFIKDYQSDKRPPLSEQTIAVSDNDGPLYLSHWQIRAILEEISRVNAVIKRLLIWRDINYNNSIRSVDEYIYKEGNDNYWLETYTK